MESIVLNGEDVNINSLSIDKLKKILMELDSEELKLKKELDSILEKLD